MFFVKINLCIVKRSFAFMVQQFDAIAFVICFGE
jgi:hypothetical protein